MRRQVPIIGLSTYAQRASWGNWERPAAIVPAGYVDIVTAAGARPVLLPALAPAAGTYVDLDPGLAGMSAIDDVGGLADADRAAIGAYAVMGAIDALVLVGGEDVDPVRYGQSASENLGQINLARDANEFALLAAAMDTGIPVLAICRGMQVLNVYLGGTLHQHLPDIVGHKGHQSAPGHFSGINVEATDGTVIAKAMGNTFRVLCSHHQSIDRLGAGLTVTAQATDGVIEAVEMDADRFVVGVQWHPEESGDSRLVAALMDYLATRGQG